MITEFFHYEDLTWPQIRDLPHHTPLVIPLGSGYSLSQLANALGNPDRIGLLPAIPYGWRNSGLEVPEPLLGVLVSNLLDSLRQDGFAQVLALTPPGIDLELHASQLALPLNQPGLPPLSIPHPEDQDKVILVPVGHTEQHAFHLPMSTDTLIIEAIGQGSAQQAAAHAVCLPVFPYGVSMHRSSFAGTLNTGGRAFEDFWVAVIDTLTQRGFDKTYLLSGHGGNMSFLNNVIKYAGDRHPHIFCATAYLYLSGPQGIEALEKMRQSKIGGMGHACELETSFILHLRPDLVHIEQAVDEIEFISTPSYYMDWIEGGCLAANPPWDDDTATGAYGAGSLGTAEKGRFWLQAAIDEKIGHIHEILEQQQRRLAKRKQRHAS